MVVSTKFHIFYGRSFARVLYFVSGVEGCGGIARNVLKDRLCFVDTW